MDDEKKRESSMTEQLEQRYLLQKIDEMAARLGYKVVDGDGDSVIVRNSHADRDYLIRIEEMAL